MKFEKSQFQAWIELEELPRIRTAIRTWGKPSELVEQYGGARLHDHLAQWQDFVETDWTDWDRSEYSHDIGCRIWVQLVLEYTGSDTCERIRRAVEPLDALFKARMVPATNFCRAPTPILSSHPYFWETHTIHPELGLGTEPLPIIDAP